MSDIKKVEAAVEVDTESKAFKDAVVAEEIRVLGLKEADLIRSFTIGIELADALLAQEKDKLPVERLAAFKQAAEHYNELAVPPKDTIRKDSLIIADFIAKHQGEIEKDPNFGKDEIEHNVEIISQDIKDVYKALLDSGLGVDIDASVKARPGVIPALESSISAADGRFAKFETAAREKQGTLRYKIRNILAEVTAAIPAIKNLKIADADEAAHYGVLMQAFENRLQGSIKQAQARYDSKDFAKADVVLKTALSSVRAEISVIDTLGITDEDEKSHYLALLRDRCNYLEKIDGQVLTDFNDLMSKINQVHILKRIQAVRDARAALHKTTATQPTAMLVQFPAAAAAKSATPPEAAPAPAFTPTPVVPTPAPV